MSKQRPEGKEGEGGWILDSPRLGTGPARQRARAQRQAARLRGQPLAAVVPDRGVGDLEAAQQPQRLGEVARGHPHLVAVALERLDHRSHDEHVGAVGEVDPNAHRQTVSPGDTWQAPGCAPRCHETILIALGRARADRALHPGIVDAPVLILASVTESVVTATWHFVRDGGLPAVFVLMALGSACIPIPSEVVMLFAGFAVADPGGSGAHHHLTMTGIVLAGLAGTLVGSWVGYAIGRGGRLELMERHGHRVHMGPAQFERADRWFSRYGEMTVLFGRVIPLVRAFVSLPAGVAKMPLPRFSVLTVIGSIPWVLALAIAGHAVGGDWTSVRKGFEYIDYAIVALVVVGIVYWIVRRRRVGPVAAVEAPAVDPDRVSSPESSPVDIG